MEKTLKRRLVGALVLVLLAIILVPAWLDGSARRLRDEDAFVVPLPPPDTRKPLAEPKTIGAQLDNEIPKLDPLPEPEPIVESQNIEVKDETEVTAEVLAEPQQEPAAVIATSDVVPDPVEVDLDSPSEASESAGAEPQAAIEVEVAESVELQANWIVQVGSFASRENAEAMVERLKNGQLKAFMRDFNSNGDSIYRVLVGPFVRQTEADDAKRTIDRRFQVKSFVANWRE